MVKTTNELALMHVSGKMLASVFEMLDAHHNNGPGFFIQRGGNNLFLNCDSH